jgi:hypothetical protein
VSGKMSAVPLLSFCALAVSIPAAYGQEFEVAPLFGGIFGLDMQLRHEGQPDRTPEKLDNAVSFGAAGGYRFDATD